jgi:hypothetical protein
MPFKNRVITALSFLKNENLKYNVSLFLIVLSPISDKEINYGR